MTIHQATDLIKQCAEHMNARYKKPVFDEWAIVSVQDRPRRLLAYIGPRRENFQRDFLADAGPLRVGLLTEKCQVGDFEFARHGVRTGFDSFMSLGKGLILICNNTVQSMDGITQDPLWLAAQVPFVDLGERFRSDPVALSV